MRRSTSGTTALIAATLLSSCFSDKDDDDDDDDEIPLFGWNTDTDEGGGDGRGGGGGRDDDDDDWPDSDSGWWDTGWWDTGWGWDTGDDDAWVTSCDLIEWSICIEFEGYPDSDTWCTHMGDDYDISTGHYDEGCPAGFVADCSVDGDASATDDYPVDLSIHYYDPWTRETASDACDEAGGL